jgi:DNA helicase HerA-like ATPase
MMKLELTAEGAGLRLDTPPYSEEGLTISLTGNKGSGKSNALAVLAEEAHRIGLPFIYYDPNGDCASLRELGEDVLVVGNVAHRGHQLRQAHYPLNAVARDAADFIKMVLDDGYSLCVDLSRSAAEEPVAAFTRLMQAHFALADFNRTPAMILVDEAYRFAPQMGADDDQKASLKTLQDVATDGRKRGMMLVTATQRATYLHKSVIFGANVRLFGKITWLDDYKKLRDTLPPGFSHPKHGFGKMSALGRGEFVIVSEQRFGVIQMKRRETVDLGKTPAFERRQKTRPSIQQLQLPIPITRSKE